jgi:hypothetical protein
MSRPKVKRFPTVTVPLPPSGASPCVRCAIREVGCRCERLTAWERRCSEAVVVRAV